MAPVSVSVRSRETRHLRPCEEEFNVDSHHEYRPASTLAMAAHGRTAGSLPCSRQREDATVQKGRIYANHHALVRPLLLKRSSG